MAKKKETIFKERVQRDLDKLANCWFVKIQQVSLRGIPDFLICVYGRFIAIELKESETAPRNKLQEWTLQAIAHSGGMSYVAWPDTWPDILESLEYLAKDNNNIDSEYDLIPEH